LKFKFKLPGPGPGPPGPASRLPPEPPPEPGLAARGPVPEQGKVPSESVSRAQGLRLQSGPGAEPVQQAASSLTVRVTVTVLSVTVTVWAETLQASLQVTQA